MTTPATSLVFPRISARFVEVLRTEANLRRKCRLASLVICNFPFPMLLNGKEILHI